MAYRLHLKGSRSTLWLAADRGRSYQSNVAELTGAGFTFLGTGTVAKGNIAIANQWGFFVAGTGTVVSGNLAQGNDVGFVAHAGSTEPANRVFVSKNVAIGNDIVGFHISLVPENTAAGVGEPGTSVPPPAPGNEFPGSIAQSGLKPTANGSFGVPFRGLFSDSAREFIPGCRAGSDAATVSRERLVVLGKDRRAAPPI